MDSEQYLKQFVRMHEYKLHGKILLAHANSIKKQLEKTHHLVV